MTPWGFAKETGMPLWKAWLTYPLYVLVCAVLLLIGGGIVAWEKIQSFKKGRNG